ncbi:ImmA/IrrE family metallo-endopeptidase [Pseudomonas kilonensis]|uniref:ImmA/IrrE family metallo-endopeptidase n=1 Tax=Pseudomonas kilonensis TaxID=132476 RepID=UPI0020A05FB4|nr:ImmA/IrrE family metallo-endopeptidase [Pseudomonas kilonensis]MCP1456113.1 Zn-dependent peptidase ImmA (M78 family) [Pseudomonas kilonensis]
MDKTDIEKEASDLLRMLWRDRYHLWGGREITPFQARDPRMAALVYGFEYQEFPNLGDPKFNQGGFGPKIAGLIDRQASRVAISQEFSPTVKLFTGAHEIGHLALHKGEVMHRDRALDGRPFGGPRNSEEREADFFAACFLMPGQLVTDRFRHQFLCRDSLHFDDTVAYHVDANNIEGLLDASADSLERELALARCQRFNNVRFFSLAEQFGVSDSAMALRLKELGLVRWP